MMKKRNFRNFYPNKYNNTKCECLSEHKHDSRAEAGYCDQLRLLKKAKEIKSYETQVSFPMTVNGKTICTHRVDFVVTLPNGKKEAHEVKGFATDVWNLKRKLFEAIYEMPYIVIKV